MIKKHYVRLHILEILYKNNFLFSKINSIYTKDKKNIIDESEKLFKI